MAKFYYHNLGKSWAVGIEGSNKEEVEAWFNGFWNHGATSGELQWFSNNFGYFWTTEKKLKRSLYNMSIHKFMDDKEGEELEKWARTQAVERFESFIEQRFVVMGKNNEVFNTIDPDYEPVLA
jgi:hypothetical protein